MAEIQPGETVLVIGATGGVGNVAIQLAKRTRATVLATAATDEGRELVTRLGGDVIVDHTAGPDVVTRAGKDHAPDGVDVVLHFAGERTEAAAHARQGGRLSSPLVHGAQAPLDDLTVHDVFADITKSRLTLLADLLAQGDLEVEASRVFDLGETGRGIRSLRGGQGRKHRAAHPVTRSP